MQIRKSAGILICLLLTFICRFPNDVAAEHTRDSQVSNSNAFNIKKNFDLRARFSYAREKFDLYGKKHTLPNYGMRLEMLRGFQISDIPNLRTGISVSYLQIGKIHSFTADVNPGPGITNKTCEMTAMLTGTMVMVKSSYDFNIGKTRLSIENGFGIGYFYQRNDWKFKNTDGTDFDGDMERAESAKPVLDIGINIDILRRERSNLSLSLNRLVLPVLIEIDKGATTYGPYKLEFIDEFGIIWRTFF